MLYRGSEVMREVAWVIFDEIHYMRDPGPLIFCVDTQFVAYYISSNRAWCGVGRDYHPSPTQGPACVFISDDSQRNGVR